MPLWLRSGGRELRSGRSPKKLVGIPEEGRYNWHFYAVRTPTPTPHPT